MDGVFNLIWFYGLIELLIYVVDVCLFVGRIKNSSLYTFLRWVRITNKCIIFSLDFLRVCILHLYSGNRFRFFLSLNLLPLNAAAICLWWCYSVLSCFIFLCFGVVSEIFCVLMNDCNKYVPVINSNNYITNSTMLNDV